MEDNEERPSVYGGDGEFRPAKATESVDEEVESMISWLMSMDSDDDEVKELSSLLEVSTEKTYPVKVKIIDEPCWLPLIFQTAASYITINGNEESCGSSFSDSDVSYMAGINAGCGLVAVGGACNGDAEETRGWVEMEEGGDDYLVKESTGGYCDDDMLARFLGEDFGPVQEEMSVDHAPL